VKIRAGIPAAHPSKVVGAYWHFILVDLMLKEALWVIAFALKVNVRGCNIITAAFAAHLQEFSANSDLVWVVNIRTTFTFVAPSCWERGMQSK